MKIIILGSGIIGVTSAYFLNKQGYDVTVIDRRAQSGAESSFANGGQLSYCYAEPWATPKAILNGLKWMGQDDAPLRLRFQPDIHMWTWLARFIWNARPAQVSRNNIELLKIGLYSREIMHEIEADIDFEFNYQKTGKFFTYMNQADFEHAKRNAEFQAKYGAISEILTPAQMVEREPSLAHIQNELVGGRYHEQDETADCHQFTVNLTKQLVDRGVKFLYNMNIEDIQHKNGNIQAIKTNEGDITGDKYVMAMGSYSAIALRKIGINLPIYPLKGYSISIDIDKKSAQAPQNSITDSARRIVFTRLGNILRVVGTAEFAGYDDSICPTRIDILKNAAKHVFPDCGDVDNADEWACLRSCTPSGIPIIGQSKYSNLFINTGHSSLGWTQAAGSAKNLLEIISGNASSLSSLACGGGKKS